VGRKEKIERDGGKRRLAVWALHNLIGRKETPKVTTLTKGDRKGFQ